MAEEAEKREWLAAARTAMEIEAHAVTQAAGRLDGALVRAVELILAHPGKVVVTGIGKSGHVARKLVATLSSTGTAAVFLHPAEATHGDLGIYTPGDPTVLISKNGSSAELLALVPLLRDFNSPLIGILGATSRRWRRWWTCCWTPRWSAKPIRTTWRPRPARWPPRRWAMRWPSP